MAFVQVNVTQPVPFGPSPPSVQNRKLWPLQEQDILGMLPNNRRQSTDGDKAPY